MTVRNCPLCGRVFEYSEVHTVCTSCWQKNENDFRIIKEYLYENPNKNIVEVAEATGFSIEKIRAYLREGRLIAVDNHSASVLSCQKCGAAIQTGNYCDSCKRQVEAELAKAAVSNSGRYRDVKMHTRRSSYGRR
ncbi:MAG: MerR family transcriptional regulator [Bacillota bacterium]